MKRVGCLTVFVLACGFSALASDKADKPDKDKKDKKPAAAAVAVPDPVEHAREKIAAGDLDGAQDILSRSAGGPGENGGLAGLALGQLLETRGQIDTAADAYKAAAEKLSGKHKGEALARAALLLDLRGLEGFAPLAEAALASDPEGVWPLAAAAHLRADAGQAEEALALARRAEAAGGGPIASLALARAQEAAGDVAAAEAAYRVALADPSTKLTASLGLARLLRMAGRPAEGEPLVRAVVDALPGVIEAYKESARILLALGRPEEAMADATLAAVMAETDVEARQLRDECAVAKALQLAGKGQASYALPELERLIAESTQPATLWVGVGRVRVLQRQAPEALAALAKAVEAEPSLAPAHYWTGYTHHMLKQDSGAALPHYEKAVQLSPDAAEYRTQLGSVLLNLGQFDRAAAELGRATASPGYKNAEGFMFLGAAELGAKRYPEALAALGRAAALAPDNVQIETFMAWACFGQKDAPGFMEHARKAKALGQKDARLLDYLARVEKGEAIK